MLTEHEELPNTQIEQLRVTESDKTNHHPGEVVGYRCSLCFQSDESKAQIYHEDDCPLAGEHGRQYYDDEEMKPVSGGETPELDPEHTIIMVRSAETDTTKGVERGSPVMWLCEFCKNGDETIDEVKHDENCPLATECDNA